MSRPKTILLYAGVVLAATAAFLYLRFPKEMIKDFISAQISRSAPDVKVDIETLTPDLPAGITMKNVDLTYQNQLMFVADQAEISARPASLLSAKKTISYDLETSGGEIKGHTIIRGDATGSGVDVKAMFSSIQLKSIPAIQALSKSIKTIPKYEVAGILDGYLNVNGSERNGSAQTAFTISQCAIKLTQPYFGIDSLNFQLVDVELAMNGQRVTVKKCDLNGEEVDGRIRGSLTIGIPYGRTRLNLSGVLKPQPAFTAKLSKMIPVALLSGTNIQRKGIPFKITGTIDNPGFSPNLF